MILFNVKIKVYYDATFKYPFVTEICDDIDDSI